jgi:hypothetical protein
VEGAVVEDRSLRYDGESGITMKLSFEEFKLLQKLVMDADERHEDLNQEVLDYLKLRFAE